jgi:hypothetical protein
MIRTFITPAQNKKPPSRSGGYPAGEGGAARGRPVITAVSRKARMLKKISARKCCGAISFR